MCDCSSADEPGELLYASKPATHRFHCCDEVHGLLVDLVLQETESLVVEDQADG